jgi:hypothetical protein
VPPVSQNERVSPEMAKMMKEFSGDFRVMRVIFASSDPIATLHHLHHTYSYKTFVDMYEYLEAKETLEEDAKRKIAMQAPK